MLLSDFLTASSTHALLYRLFASEVGLASVSHPQTQYEALAQAMPSLKASILDRLEGSTELDFFNGDNAYLGKLVISFKADARLFVELFGTFNSFPEDSVLVQHVYPVAGQMIAGNAELKEFVLAQLQYHVRRYPAAVANRIFETLILFDLTLLVPSLRECLSVQRLT